MATSERIRETAGRSTGSRPPFGVSATAVLITLGTLIPLGFVVTVTATTGWETAVDLIVRPRVGELLFNTIALVVLTVPACIVLGVAAAWLVERTDLPGARTASLLLAAPLAVPAFVNSYAWAGTVPSLSGIPGGVLISVLSYYPLVYIPAAAMLRRLDPGLEQSAASLGMGPWRVFFRVVLPQLRLAVGGGALLVGLHLLAEYGAYSMIRFDTFTTAILQQFQSTFNSAAANMLASVLVMICLLLLLAESAARGNARYARIGPGVAAAPAARPLARWKPAGVLFVLALIVLALGVPLVNVVRWLIAGGTAVWEVDELATALFQTLGYGVTGAAVTVLAAFPIAWLAVRYGGRFARFLESSNYITSSMPGIVVALAFVTVTINFAYPLYQETPVVIAAYALLFLPRALVNLRAGFAQAPRELEEAAQALGKRPLDAFVRVTLRLTAPAAAAGAALVFLAVSTELTATLVLAPSGVTTLATRFWALSSEIDYAGAAPYALLLILLSLPMTYLLYRQSQKAVGQ
ncbi:iron ABC transporter permease [Arthrobacter sp. MSA 4-2]|uniref:ABC transporter permease n=1 Tax=Arthrobacter sp. MSA 4-2 TaxID=2794349 RepID=UPI0018E7F822|nr:iron ABC transporter permease [Arthrobacter sp. MSA 4-2]MBJ2120823.1 iron ABC transporter permease [Arthrobacter sp. MSA 4-2]